MKGIVILLLLVALSPVSFGQELSYKVTVDREGQTAQGSLTWTRQMDDPPVHISCDLVVRAAKQNGPKTDVYHAICSADDGTSSGSCLTDQDDFIDVIASADTASHVLFEWDDNGNCTRVEVTKRSDLLVPHYFESPPYWWGVTIQLPNNWAEGTLQTGDYIDDYIGCKLTAATDKSTKGAKSPKPSIYRGSCTAGKGSLQVSCITDKPAFLNVIASLNSASHLYFRWDENGNCAQINNSQRSYFIGGHPE